MDRRKLACPSCGGDAIEERGNVRYFGRGYAVEKIDGEREWVDLSWSTPVETLVMDELPYHCAGCGEQFDSLDKLVVMRGAAMWGSAHLVHVSEAGSMLCGADVVGATAATMDDDVSCPACLEALERLSQPGGALDRAASRAEASVRLSEAENG